MMAEALESASEVVPGTPSISEMRSDNGSELFDLKRGSKSPSPWIRRVNGRAEIDASPGFESVKEAVHRYGGSGTRMAICKHGHSCRCIEEFGMKRMEEQTAELEKDLIVKELEALDVLEKLGSTKKVVEKLKQELRNEVSSFYAAAAQDLQCQEQISSPAFTKMDLMSRNSVNSFDQTASWQHLILMELQKANLNLGKMITDLKMIQASIDFLNRKMEKEKTCPEQGRNSLSTRIGENLSVFTEELHRFKERTELSKAEMIELKWVAAKKMEEAARAAAIVALAEIQALKGNGISQEQAMLNCHGHNSSNLQATQKLNLGKQTLEEALNRDELENQKQHSGKEACHYYSNSSVRKGSPLMGLARPNAINSDKMPVIRPAISMRDVLRKKKQVLSEEYRARKVDLRQMLWEMRDDITAFPSGAEEDGDGQKNFISERKKLGFVHINPGNRPL